MKDNSDIFVIIDNALVFNKEEARLIDEYNAIIVRDKGSPGDSQARKKIQAFKELMYIHIVNHPSSIYRDLPDRLRKEKARNLVGLAEDWKEDDLIKQATKRFIEDLKCTSLYYSFVNASRGIYSIGEDLNYFNNRRDKIKQEIFKLEDKILNLQDNREDAEKRYEYEQKIDTLTNELIRIANNVTNLTTILPKANEDLTKLKEQLANESTDGSAIKGGGVIGNREA